MGRGTPEARRAVPDHKVRHSPHPVSFASSTGETPADLEGAKMTMLVNRETPRGLGITVFESEEAMRRGDGALNAMSPGTTERRTSVDFYEVPVQTIR